MSDVELREFEPDRELTQKYGDYRIFLDGDSIEGYCKVLYCEVGGGRYSINVDWVPENQLEWLARVFSGNILEARASGMRAGQRGIKSALKPLKDLLDSI